MTAFAQDSPDSWAIDEVSATEFSPRDMLNREQAAKFLTTTAIACGKDVKGVGANKFDPQGSYQRQQSFMTMYRIYNAIDMENIATIEEPNGKTMEEIEKEITNEPYYEDFTAYMVGTSTTNGDVGYLGYDVYYRESDLRVNSYDRERMMYSYIYADLAGLTFTKNVMFDEGFETTDGNTSNIQLLRNNTFTDINDNKKIESVVWRYETLNSEDVLYIKTVEMDNTLTETWYSLKYKIAVKYNQKWSESSDTGQIEWTVTSIVEGQVDDSLLDRMNY